MKNINDFIKKLKVLYVEDEESARNIFGKFLNKKFETSVSCSNGLDAFIEYDKSMNNNEPFDLIISDINMPKMNGIELLEKIRDNSNTPFIFTTARSETEQMIKAINLNVNYYLLKPLDFNIVETNIQKICEDIYYKKNYEIQKKETEAYLSLLNKEAIVSKTDLNGNITFVNDAFLEISGFLEEEVLGKNHNILRHPDNPASLYKNLWDTISSGKIWEGKIKNLSKEGETYFINTKIMPIFDDTGKNIIEYISIRFLVTEEENSKRIQSKRFFEQITLYKKEISVIKKERDELLQRINNFNASTYFLKEKNISYEKKIKNLLAQVESYEKNNLELSKVDYMMKQDKQKQFEQINKEMLTLKTNNRIQFKQIETLKKLLAEKTQQLEEFENKRLEYEKRIENLLDLVNNLQKEVKVLKGEELKEEK